MVYCLLVRTFENIVLIIACTQINPLFKPHQFSIARAINRFIYLGNTMFITGDIKPQQQNR